MKDNGLLVGMIAGILIMIGAFIGYWLPHPMSIDTDTLQAKNREIISYSSIDCEIVSVLDKEGERCHMIGKVKGGVIGVIPVNCREVDDLFKWRKY